MNIRIENIVKKYGKNTVLKNISLEIKDGELFFLLGPSGCGKTTLLRSIGGFEKIQGGKIFSGDKEIQDLPAAKRPTAMVFQGYALWPHLTVAENIAFGLHVQHLSKKECNERIQEIMEQMQITEYAKRKPNELSGGQQQRVALARTLVVQPECLLLDEPLANLDAKLRRDMRLEIRNICKNSGITSIYVTHDRQEALSMADRLAIMEDGEFRQIGTPQEVYRHPNSAFIANFIGETNIIHGVVTSVKTGFITVQASDTELTVTRHPSSPTVKPNQKILLSIRPEAFTIQEGAKNSIMVRLQQLDYLGEIACHICTLSDHSGLKFYELNPILTRHPGDRIRLQVSPDDITILDNSAE
ncbi:MAG: ABC transporter ATP-binding protein [Lentisphaeria bacterium]